MRDRPAINLAQYHKKRESKGVAVYSTWYYDEAEKEYEPCLVVIRSDLKGKPGLIPLGSAYAYDDPKRGHKHLLTMSKLFNAGMMRADTMADVHHVADLIHGSLLDLIVMPPRPEELKKAVADAVMVDKNTGREQHAVIME